MDQDREAGNEDRPRETPEEGLLRQQYLSREREGDARGLVALHRLHRQEPLGEVPPPTAVPAEAQGGRSKGGGSTPSAGRAEERGQKAPAKKPRQGAR